MQTKDVDAVREAYRAMYRAMVARDTEALGSVLDDSFVLVHMTGRRQTKDEFLRCVADGSLAYFGEVEESVEVTVDPDGMQASLTGKSLVDAAPFGAGRSTWRLRQDIDLVKRGDVWLMVEARAHMY